MNLELYKDNKYREFHQKLITSSYPLLGVKITILRKLAKDIDLQDYVDSFKPNYYEDVILYGILISKEKNISKRIELIKDYIKYIDCWSICDTFCSNLSFIKRDLDAYFDWIISYLEDDRTFYIRFGLVMLLKYYNDSKYLNRILSRIEHIKNEDYYCQMAIAWLMCEFAVKNKTIIDKFVLKLSNNVQKMYERKVKDSLRIK